MKITLYSTHCPKCVALEKKLKMKNIKYDEVNNVEVMMEKGYVAVPILEVDGVSMDFKTASEWINNN